MTIAEAIQDREVEEAAEAVMTVDVAEKGSRDPARTEHAV